MSNTQVPVVLFAFNRVKQLRYTLKQLKRNNIPKLIVFVDGPRDEKEKSKVESVVRIINNISWTSVKLITQKQNIGLSNSIVSGLNRVFLDYDKAIVIEDDIIVADGFYSYICTALEAYGDRKDIAGITGLHYPLESNRLKALDSDVYMAPRFSSWGWATWRNKWLSIDFNKESLLRNVAKNNTDLSAGGEDIALAFREWRSGRLSGCWDVIYSVNMLLSNTYFIWPKYNLITNAGLSEGFHSDGAIDWGLNATHTGESIIRMPKDIKPDKKLISDFKSYFKRPRSEKIRYFVRSARDKLRRLVYGPKQ